VAWQAFDLHMHDAECPVSDPNHTPLRSESNSSASSRNKAVHVSGSFLSNTILKT